jgi:hypothetical protein
MTHRRGVAPWSYRPWHGGRARERRQRGHHSPSMAASMAVSIAWTSPFSRSGRRLAAPDGFASPKAACPHPPHPTCWASPTDRPQASYPSPRNRRGRGAGPPRREDRAPTRPTGGGELEHAGLSRREVEVLRLDSVGAHQPRDRPRAVPQPTHHRHARPQRPDQARLSLPHRGDPQSGGAAGRCGRAIGQEDDSARELCDWPG